MRIELSCTHYTITIPSSDSYLKRVISSFINRNLIEYDNDDIKYTYVHISSKKDYDVLKFPRQTFWLFKKYLNTNNIRFVIKPCFTRMDNAENLNPYIRMKKRIKPKDHQKPYIDFLIDSNNSMKLLDSYPGSGKTFSTTYAIVQLKKKALIIMPLSLLQQWYDRLREYTTIRQQDIYPIVGSKALYELNYRIYNNEPITESIFLCSITTLHNYIKNNNPEYLSLDQLFAYLKCGIKVHDEVHLNFHQNVLIDLHANIPVNFYLTATPGRSVYKSDRIFKLIYPNYIQLHTLEHDNSVKVYSAYYNFHWHYPLPEKYFIIKDVGYSQNRYEKYILRRPGLVNQLDDILLSCIQRFYFNGDTPKGRMLIFANTGRMIKHIVQSLQQAEELKQYDLKISQFMSNDPKSILSTSDIIVTTIGSSGVGKDISNISCILCFISIRSSILTKQIIGRIRESDIETTNFVFLVNEELRSHRKHDKIRQSYVKIKKVKI